MTAAEVLQTVRRSGGEILAVGSQLRLLLPPNVISPELLASAKERKAELLALISAGPPEADAPLLSWLSEAIEGSRERSRGCFLCRWILESISDGQLRPTGRSDGSGGELFPVASQLVHLRLECGGPGAMRDGGTRD